MTNDFNTEDMNSIAIIGMAGSFPKSNNIEEFWSNLQQGKDCISHYTLQELTDANIERDFLEHKNYVKAKGTLENIDLFDASFFDIGPREAELMDPQHRLMLECATHALEHAGYNPDLFDGLIGIFAGESMSSYAFLNVLPTIKALLSTQSLQAAIGNDKDSLTTTVAYHLNLRGPAITIQTASSTSLVAVSLACQQLISYQCDIALAGGVSAGPPIVSGYLYEEGGISSPDGKCRPFDEKSNGFVPGSGVGLVVLKRLHEAIRDNDTIWAVIKGFAINNDGNKKVSYSAPSVDAQAEVVSLAQEFANFHPETLSYVEAHGTATNLGDPIEIAALSQAFRRQTQKKNYCAIGSVKSNIGHLDTAAGVAGLIKTALCLNYKKLVPTLNFHSPNPALNLQSSPFFVATKTIEWKRQNGPLRAGVTSLGMGGTNSHVVLEEAPPQLKQKRSFNNLLITLSAKTPTALCKHIHNLYSYLKKEESISFDDVAFTMNVGRRIMKFKASFVFSTKEELLNALLNYKEFQISKAPSDPKIVFQYCENMNGSVGGGKLYHSENGFKMAIDKCLNYLSQEKRDLLLAIFSTSVETNLLLNSDKNLFSFICKYALACFFIDLGITPEAQIGEGIGELVAAVIAESIDLETALKIVNCQLEGKLLPQSLPFSAPKIPFISHVTGQWISDDEAISHSYWQLWNLEGENDKKNRTQEFLNPSHLFLGIGDDVIEFQNISSNGSLSSIYELNIRNIYLVIGRLFENGVFIDWSVFYKERKAGRIPLPTYPFERKKYWVEPNFRLRNESQTINFQPRPSLANPYLPPTTSKEREIVKFWENELCIQPIGITDDFFDLGGCSLAATSLMATINGHFQNKIALREFYANPTIQAIVRLLEIEVESIDFEALIDEVSSLTNIKGN